MAKGKSETADAVLPAKVEATAVGLFGTSVTIASLKAAWADYMAIKAAVTEDDDYMWVVARSDGGAVDGKSKSKFFVLRADAVKFAEILERRGKGLFTVPVRGRIKKSGVLKIRKAMSLIHKRDFAVKVAEQRDNWPAYSEGKAKILSYEFQVNLVATGPDGVERLLETEVGACSTAERRSGADGFAHIPHDLISTALTRASVRVMMKYFGFGELTAEEVDGRAPAAPTVDATLADAAKAPPVQARKPKPAKPAPAKKPAAAKVEPEPAAEPPQEPAKSGADGQAAVKQAPEPAPVKEKLTEAESGASAPAEKPQTTRAERFVAIAELCNIPNEKAALIAWRKKGLEKLDLDPSLSLRQLTGEEFKSLISALDEVPF